MSTSLVNLIYNCCSFCTPVLSVGDWSWCWEKLQDQNVTYLFFEKWSIAFTSGRAPKLCLHQLISISISIPLPNYPTILGCKCCFECSVLVELYRRYMSNFSVINGFLYCLPDSVISNVVSGNSFNLVIGQTWVTNFMISHVVSEWKIV